MSNTVLFENYTWNNDFTDLPKFADFIKNNGKSHTSAPTSISRYNEMKSGKRATLHHTCINAIERYGNIITMQASHNADQCLTAFGVQKNASGEITHYCCEYRNSANETIAGVYIPKTGKFKAIVMDANGIRKNVPTIKRNGYDGDICMFLICAYSYDTNTEFNQMIAKYYNAVDPLNRGDIENMFVMCDNLYRRVESVSTTSRFSDARIPCDIPSSGNIPPITELNLNHGEFTPTECISGKFSILTGGRKKTARTAYRTLDDVKAEFHMHLQLSAEESVKVAELDNDKYRPSPYLVEMARMAKAGMRIFMLRGEAGTGKTTDARALSYVTGLPYRRFTCSENTDETGLIVNMIPNTGKKVEKVIDFPTLQDIMMDPATALAKLTGEYADGIESEKAFTEILHQVATQAYDNAKEEKDFVMVESEIIKGCQMPSIVEIQEPACISKQATMVALNSLFDEGRAVTLMDGTEIERNPDSIFVFTTNSNYRGCRDFNESVLSRMEEIIDYDTPGIAELTTRVMKKTGIDAGEKGNIEIMAGIIRDIQEYCRENMITGGVCCTREFENWVRSYIVKGDMKEACKFTVISKISNDQEIRDEVTKACIDTKL